jgi:phosphate transport system protein
MIEERMRYFDEQLKELLHKIVLMASMAESMIASAVRGLIERSETPMRTVFDKEKEVNRLQIEIDDTAVRLAATQQPVGADIRFLFMASRIVSELERIGDQAINICQNARHVLAHPPLRPMVDIPIMAEVVQKMVRQSLTAMLDRDVELAEHVLEEEKKVDAFKDQIFRTLLTYMMADPGTIQRALSLILLSRNLERIGDHATNIAEEVIYIVQGRDVRHSGGPPPPAIPSSSAPTVPVGSGRGGHLSS